LKKKAIMASFAGALSLAILHALFIAVDFPDPGLPRIINKELDPGPLRHFW
jgi:hypothetical protein